MTGERERNLRAMRPWQLALPRWWPTWAGVALLRLSALLPLGVTRVAGRGIGLALYAASRERRRITRINLRLCFSRMDDNERERLVRRHFAMLGESIFEMAYGWWAPERRLARLGELSGEEHLHTALGRGKGVILLQGHFLTTDIAGQILGTRLPFVATYARPKNAVARFLLERLRGRFVQRQIHHTELRPILRALAANEIVWHGPDQGRRRGSKVAATFFGQPANTSLATAKLARMSGAAVVPYHPLRRSDGTYELRFEPALPDFPGDDLASATQRVNDAIEAQVRVAPEQYLWCHRRFKASRRGAPSPYE